MPLIAHHDFTAYPVLRLLLVMDPTCDESANNEAAFAGAMSGAFGWGPNAVLINTVIDPGSVPVVVEVWDEPAVRIVGESDVVAESALELPGGRLHSLQATDEATQRGFDLPAGPGTYQVRVSGLDRDGAIGSSGRGENYLIQLWQVSDRPRWEDGDDEDEDAMVPGRAYAVGDEADIRMTDGTVEVFSEGHWKPLMCTGVLG